MKIAVLIPTRGNRPDFLKNCLRMIDSQTIKPDHIELVDFKPTSENCDITVRYKSGYDNLRRKNFDVLFLMEDDDFYAKDYIEHMLLNWEKNGRPDIFGTNYTIYYHIRLFSWFTFYHETRSSAMSTMIVPDLKIDWPVDEDPYTDIKLWLQLKGKTFKPEKHICLGIKHGTGMTGGELHINLLHRYVNMDENKTFIKGLMDAESFNFYSTFIK